MHAALGGDKGRSHFGLRDRRPFDCPARLKLFVPGWPQLSWKQRDRAAVFMGSFLTSILVAAWTWGSWVSWVLIAFAFFSQVASANDALRQSSFPFYCERTAIILVSTNLAFVVYAPATLILSTVAWPGYSDQEGRTAYAVNRWAYRDSTPRIGDWIWAPFHSRGKPHAALIVATQGQEVEWNGRNWRIDGLPRSLHSAPRLTGWPPNCRFHVPDDQVLVEPEGPEGAISGIGPLVLVPSDAIVGRVWARLYPMWDRHLL